MNHLAFHLKPQADLEIAWEELHSCGLQPLYSSEEPGGSRILYATVPVGLEVSAFEDQMEWIEAITKADLTIDWEAQWASHGLDYKEGFVHVDPSSYGHVFLDAVHPPPIKLEAGPGFGDLSHPTTRLMLKMMANRMTGQYVVDVGCGSGVLSLCAVGMGAKSAYGVDIDPEAILHSRSNAKLNGFEKQIIFGLPGSLPNLSRKKPLTILMNMIWSEQTAAWQALPKLHKLSGEILTSGILEQDRDCYLAICKNWGLSLIQQQEEEGWLGFRFKL
jgi:ribosomal protein L11 methyltransferase